MHSKDTTPDDASDTGSIEFQQNGFNRNDILVCATHGKIYAIHKRTGARIWRTDFPTGGQGGVVSLFVTDYNTVIAGARGRTACLDLMTGNPVWVNKMPGFGLYEVSVIATPSTYIKSDISPGEYASDYSNGRERMELPVIIGCAHGKVMGINPKTGNPLWEYDCPGGGYRIPVAIVEPPSARDGRPQQLLYVGVGKYVYCLKALKGELVWKSKVSNAFFGYGYMTLATPWSSRLAAEAHTAFNQNPSGQARELEREKEQEKQRRRQQQQQQQQMMGR